MTGNKYLLDTNIIAAWLKGEKGVTDKIAKDKRQIQIPVIVIGELYYGAMYSTHTQKNVEDIETIISNFDVLPIDVDTTIVYGEIKAALRKKGKPLPENDIWIAAIAQRYKLTIITRDKHFKEIESITVKSW